MYFKYRDRHYEEVHANPIRLDRSNLLVDLKTKRRTEINGMTSITDIRSINIE